MKAAAQEHDKSTEWWAKMSKDEKGKKGSGNTTATLNDDVDHLCSTCDQSETATHTG